MGEARFFFVCNLILVYAACSKLTIEARKVCPWRRSGVFFVDFNFKLVNFEQVNNGWDCYHFETLAEFLKFC